MQNKGEFLKHLQQEVGLEDRERTEMVAQAVLRQLHERLGPEASDLEAQLPEDMKPLFHGGITGKVKEAVTPQSKKSYDEIVDTVADDGGIARTQADRATRAVFHQLKQKISEGESRHVAAVLPNDMVAVWESA